MRNRRHHEAAEHITATDSSVAADLGFSGNQALPLQSPPPEYGWRPPPAPPPPATINGATVIPQIVIGHSPSHAGAPIGINDNYRSFPFVPDTAIDGWSTPTLTVRGTSVRGQMHRLYGVPRQDDFTVHQLPGGRAVIAVADGVSQAEQSHFGANEATRFAAQWLRRNLPNDVDTTDWRALLQHTAWALNEQAQRLFGLQEPDPVRTEAELATTLVCAVVEPQQPGSLRAHIVSCGDSSAWLLSGQQFVEIAGGKQSDAAAVATSEVAGLPRVPREVKAEVVDLREGDVLLIGTDGIGEPLGRGEGAVGSLLRELLLRAEPPSLIEFAHTVDFYRETFDDDRTLVAVWPARQATPE